MTMTIEEALHRLDVIRSRLFRLNQVVVMLEEAENEGKLQDVLLPVIEDPAEQVYRLLLEMSKMPKDIQSDQVWVDVNDELRLMQSSLVLLGMKWNFLNAPDEVKAVEKSNAGAMLLSNTRH
jgi:hypothetical protein